MGTLAILRNIPFLPADLYVEYKNREEIEQYFDHFKNHRRLVFPHAKGRLPINSGFGLNIILIFINKTTLSIRIRTGLF